MRRRSRSIIILLALGVWWLAACQAPLLVDAPERPANDAFAARVVLEGAAGTVAGSSVDATAEAGEPEHDGEPAARSVWWTWTAPAAGTASFDAAGSDFEAVVAAYRGAALAELSSVGQVGGSGAVAGRAAFEVTAGEVVAIAVDGVAGASGTVALQWSLEAPAPDPDPDPDPVVRFEGAFAPEALIFAGTVGEAAPAPRTVLLTNVGDATASFELATDRGWLSVTPETGALEPAAAADLSVAVAGCTVEGSDTGVVTLVAGASAIEVAIRRDCTEPIDLPTLDLALDRLYVNQSVPAQDTARPIGERVPLVADRPGLLRVFVTANEANDVRPIVRLHYRYAGGPEAVLDLSGPDAVPLAVDEGVLGQTFVAQLPADVVRPGLEAYVDVVLAGEVDASNNRYPDEGYWVPDVVVMPEARFTLVPVTYLGTTPSLGDGSAYLGLTERMFPLAGVDVEVRAPITFTGDLSGGGWNQLLNELTSLRVADGSDRHYYGIVNPGYSGGVAGIAWVGYVPVGVGWHHLPSGAEVATHELGHNWGREHAPCGVSGDASYPYAGGVTGVWGFDRGTGQLKAPTLKDVMSYCSPTWTSDYTYRGVLEYRAARGYAPSGLSAPPSTTVLIASGRFDGDAVELDPLFVLDGTPRSVAPGPFELVGRAADGRELLRVPFDAAEVSLEHGRAFHLTIPIEAETAKALSAVRIERDGRVLDERSVGGIRASSASPTEATPQRDGSVAIVWDAETFEEVLVRDGVGGPVLGRDRTGRLSVRPTGNVVELLLSDGVRTERQTVRY